MVVDHWATGRPAQASPTTAAANPGRRKVVPGKLDRIAFDGRTQFTTHRLFDAKGPRTITLDPGSASVIGGVKVALAITAAAIVFVAVTAPYLLLLLVVLLQPKLRQPIRRAITAWLDRAAGQPG
ncbi:MAG: hypothetical protein B7Y47_05420 [Sphingomonas sp. 28-63-12]|nr:MAG: hypothetical protein B7Y47_05420 [Sphingomonas sp. 28-63-12]